MSNGSDARTSGDVAGRAPGLSRREAIVAGAASVAGLPSLSGCLGGDSDDGETLDSHPAAADLSAQPRLGPNPGDGSATLIAFEDPSCSRCRAFERDTVPKIESKLTDPGRGTFVFRGYPVIYPWGEPATAALEATFDRSDPAFWALKGHYYGTQSAFDADNVLDRTESFLEAETDVDGAAVVDDVERDRFDDAVQADLDAGEAGDVGRTTPIVLFFRDGQYLTKASGSVSYTLIESTLDL